MLFARGCVSKNMCMKRILILWACLSNGSHSLCVWVFVCVCVCVCVCFQVEERGGSLQQGTREWSEGNGKEMTKACSLRTATLLLSSCMETWTHTHTRTHSLLLLLWLWWKLWYTGSETQDGNTELRQQSERKRTEWREVKRQSEKDVDKKVQKTFKKDTPDLTEEKKLNSNCLTHLHIPILLGVHKFYHFLSRFLITTLHFNNFSFYSTFLCLSQCPIFQAPFEVKLLRDIFELKQVNDACIKWLWHACWLSSGQLKHFCALTWERGECRKPLPPHW